MPNSIYQDLKFLNTLKLYSNHRNTGNNDLFKIISVLYSISTDIGDLYNHYKDENRYRFKPNLYLLRTMYKLCINSLVDLLANQLQKNKIKKYTDNHKLREFSLLLIKGLIIIEDEEKKTIWDQINQFIPENTIKTYFDGLKEEANSEKTPLASEVIHTHDIINNKRTQLQTSKNLQNKTIEKKIDNKCDKKNKKRHYSHKSENKITFAKIPKYYQKKEYLNKDGNTVHFEIEDDSKPRPRDTCLICTINKIFNNNKQINKKLLDLKINHKNWVNHDSKYHNILPIFDYLKTLVKTFIDNSNNSEVKEEEVSLQTFIYNLMIDEKRNEHLIEKVMKELIATWFEKDLNNDKDRREAIEMINNACNYARHVRPLYDRGNEIMSPEVIRESLPPQIPIMEIYNPFTDNEFSPYHDMRFNIIKFKILIQYIEEIYKYNKSSDNTEYMISALLVNLRNTSDLNIYHKPGHLLRKILKSAIDYAEKLIEYHKKVDKIPNRNNLLNKSSTELSSQSIGIRAVRTLNDNIILLQKCLHRVENYLFNPFDKNFVKWINHYSNDIKTHKNSSLATCEKKLDSCLKEMYQMIPEIKSTQHYFTKNEDSTLIDKSTPKQYENKNDDFSRIDEDTYEKSIEVLEIIKNYKRPKNKNNKIEDPQSQLTQPFMAIEQKDLENLEKHIEDKIKQTNYSHIDIDPRLHKISYDTQVIKIDSKEKTNKKFKLFCCINDEKQDPQNTGSSCCRIS